MTNTITKITYDGNDYEVGGGGSDIVYVTQAEYEALLPGALTDGKNYFVYTSSGGGGGWQPGVNTLLYLPMKADFDDHSGNNYTITNGGATITTVSGVTCGSFSNVILTTDVPAQNKYNMTYSVWVNPSAYGNALILTGNPPGQYKGEFMDLWGGDSSSFLYARWCGIVNSSNYNDIKASISGWHTGEWHYICYSNKNLYIDGVLGATLTYAGDTYTAGNSYKIGGRDSTGRFNGYMSELIIEDGEWSATDILNYYNSTKGDYGIS